VVLGGGGGDITEVYFMPFSVLRCLMIPTFVPGVAVRMSVMYV
jgi:hypothetical protein